MARIEGAAYDSSGNVVTAKDAHIDYEITASTFSTNKHTINVKCYLDVISTPSVPTISGKTITMQYTGGTPVVLNIPANSTSIAPGQSYLLGETNFEIELAKDGSAKTIALSASATLFPGTTLDHITVSGNITLPKISNGHKKISEIWKTCFAWLKVLGTWKRCLIWRKINGVWKKGI